MRAGLSVFLPFTIGTDRDNGQVVPSECSTQFNESRWAHLRALHHRGNRGGGRVDAAVKGRRFPLEAIADDQCHLVYVPAFGLRSDVNTQHGQSAISRAERKAAEGGETAAFNQNTHVPKWVFEQKGMTGLTWTRFQKLFMVDFNVGQHYHNIVGGVGGVVGCTAEKEDHRRDRARAVAHLHELPTEPSVQTDLSKTVRLVIDPPRTDAGADITSGAVTLVYRTEVKETIGGREVVRDPVEAAKAVRKSELVKMVRAYRSEFPDDEADEARPAVTSMIVGDDPNNPARSLRREVWERQRAGAELRAETLRSIFTGEVLGEEWDWQAPASPVQAERASRPQTTATGWSAHWNNFWGWIYRNDAGAVRFDDPATELDGQQGGGRTSGASGESAAAADGGDRPRFQPPASGHGVPAVDDPMAVGDL